MRGAAQTDGVLTASDPIADSVRFFQDHRQGARPKFSREHVSALRNVASPMIERLFSRNVNNQRVGRRSIFSFKNFLNRFFVFRIGGKPIDCFGRHGHQA